MRIPSPERWRPATGLAMANQRRCVPRPDFAGASFAIQSLSRPQTPRWRTRQQSLSWRVPMDAVTRSIITAVAVVALGQAGLSGRLAAQTAPPQTREVPVFEPDPSWPKLPSKYVWGQVSSVSIDDQGNAWILQRPSTVRADQKAMAAPPVLEFDEAGNFIQGWGGPGPGYDWPETEHGIYVDPKGFVWLGGNGKTDNHLLKFTKAGKFVMQIGHKGASKGNKDTVNVNQAADTFLYAKTNELFVADGYGNRRVIVFDADTGAFKRMWGAFGNPPLDNVPPEPKVAENQ